MQHPSRPLLHTLCSTLLTPLQEVTDWSAARVAGAACRCALAELRLVSAQGDPLPTCTSLSKAWAMGHCARAWISRVNGNFHLRIPLAPKVRASHLAPALA